jgi:hypothetical protein
VLHDITDTTRRELAAIKLSALVPPPVRKE